jgi:sugar O-acyltransferase (sialic acid O-acetyltransferase NeuD family)
MSRAKPVVIYGLGELASTTLQMIRAAGSLEVSAFTVDRGFLQQQSFAGLPVVPFEEVEREYPPASHDMLLLVGYKRMRARADMFARAKAKDYRLPNLIAANSHVCADVKLGENNIIGDFVFVGPGAEFGDNNIIRPSSHIGHHAIFGHHVFVAPGAMIAGRVRVGDLSYVGLAAAVIDGVQLDSETLLLPGAVLMQDAPACGQYQGNPAQRIGEHHGTGIMLLR